MRINKQFRTRTKAKVDYLLSTKLFCGLCKFLMVGYSGTSGTSRVYHYYSRLYDIDQNGIPELILFEGSSGAGTHFHFYTIIDDEIIYCGLYGRTSLLADGEGGLIAYIARMGGYHIDKIALNGTVIETEFIAGNFIGDAEEYPELDELGYENYKYLPFCLPAVPLALYTYNQNLFPH